MALLGFLSLTGMLVKNAIVLIDQIDIEISEGKDKLLAVIDSAISRVRPVSMRRLRQLWVYSPFAGSVFFKHGHVNHVRVSLCNFAYPF
jgi:multidrug efflux pump subunit AcrB